MDVPPAFLENSCQRLCDGFPFLTNCNSQPSQVNFPGRIRDEVCNGTNCSFQFQVLKKTFVIEYIFGNVTGNNLKRTVFTIDVICQFLKSWRIAISRIISIASCLIWASYPLKHQPHKRVKRFTRLPWKFWNLLSTR